MRSSFALGLLLSFSTLACGDSTGTGGGGAAVATGGGGATSEGGAGGAGTGGEAPVCEPPEGTADPTDPVEVDTVSALARNEMGDPITMFNFQLCGADGCLYAETSVTGQATFTNNLSLGTIDRPLFKPSDTLVYGKIGYPYTIDGPSPMIGVFPTMEDSGQAFEAGASVSVAGVEVAVADDGIVTVDDLTYDEPDKQTFRAAALPADLIADATGDPDFAMVYALGPADTLFCPTGATVTFDNYADLPADAEVEIYGQELSPGEHFGGYGKWALLAEGVVSSDGSTVTTVGDGLPVLLTVAIKLKSP